MSEEIGIHYMKIFVCHLGGETVCEIWIEYGVSCSVHVHYEQQMHYVHLSRNLDSVMSVYFNF